MGSRSCQPRGGFFRRFRACSGRSAATRRCFRYDGIAWRVELSCGKVNAATCARTPMNESAGRRLRAAWESGPIAIPGAFNALVARMAERLVFRAFYLPGGALAAASGVPDVGLLTFPEFVEQAALI